MAKTTLKRPDADYRPCVGMMLLNQRGEVFVARRIDVPGDTWQMPQGGIDEGETPRQAALRELREEIGTDKAEIVAESTAWLSYDFPKEFVSKARHRPWRGQRQKWFIMQFNGTDADINLDTEHPEFAAWKWVPVSELPTLVVSFKRQVYLDLLAEFPELTRAYDGLPELLKELDLLAEFPELTRAFDGLSELLKEPIVRLAMAADSIDEKELYELLQRVANNLRRRDH